MLLHRQAQRIPCGPNSPHAAAKEFLQLCTAGLLANRRSHVQPIPYLEKWVLAREGTKFTRICRDSSYTNLYGSRTLAIWAKKDNLPKDPKRILREESRMALKRKSFGQQQTDTKLLCNSCGFNKTLFDRHKQDSHTCLVCNEPKEDRNHMFNCKGLSAVNNQEKHFTDLTKVLDDHDTSTTL